MNDALARVAGVSAIGLFVFLLAAADFGRDPVLVREPPMCRVGDGPLRSRDRYVMRLLRESRSDPAYVLLSVLEALAEQPGHAARIAAVLAPLMAGNDDPFLSEALGDLGEPGRAVLRGALLSPDPDLRRTAARALAQRFDLGEQDERALLDCIRQRDELALSIISEMDDFGGPGPARRILFRMLEEDDEIGEWLEYLAVVVGLDAARPVAERFAKSTGLARKRALEVLDALGPDAAPALEFLQGELGRCDDDERAAIFTLHTYCDAALTPAAQSMLLDDIGPRTEASVCTLLGRCTEHREAARALLRSTDVPEASFALYALDGSTPAVMARWREGLASGDLERVRGMLRGLARVGSDVRPLLAQIAPLIGVGEWGSEWQEAMVAGGAESVPLLLDVLEHEDPKNVQYALSALAAIGQPARAAAPALARRAHAGDDRARVALTCVDPSGKATIAALIRGLDDPDRRWAHVHALARLGPDARTAGPALRRLFMQDEEDSVAYALATIGAADEAVVARIEHALRTGDRTARRLSARILFAMGPQAASSLPTLLRARLDCSTEVARWATLAAAAVTGNLDATRRLLADRSQNHVVLAGMAWLAGTPGVYPDVRLVPDIAAFARRHRGDRIWPALMVLRRMGPSATAAVPTLRDIAGDPATLESVRRYVRETLTQIEGG